MNQRFMSKVDTSGDCWMWKGSLFNSGYGAFKHKGKTGLAHRVSFEFFKGEIPKGAHICHSCDIRACVNPDHLFAGSHQGNMEDRNRKGRQARGEKIKQSKLRKQQVRDIRSRVAAGERQVDLAAEFGITRTSVCDIVNRRTWRHV